MASDCATYIVCMCFLAFHLWCYSGFPHFSRASTKGIHIHTSEVVKSDTLKAPLANVISEQSMWAERKTERAENRVERSGAVNGRCWKTMERSGARSGRSRSGNGVESVGYRNRLERGAAFSPAPLTCSVSEYYVWELLCYCYHLC